MLDVIGVACLAALAGHPKSRLLYHHILAIPFCTTANSAVPVCYSAVPAVRAHAARAGPCQLAGDVGLPAGRRLQPGAVGLGAVGERCCGRLLPLPTQARLAARLLSLLEDPLGLLWRPPPGTLPLLTLVLLPAPLLLPLPGGAFTHLWRPRAQQRGRRGREDAGAACGHAQPWGGLPDQPSRGCRPQRAGLRQCQVRPQAGRSLQGPPARGASQPAAPPILLRVLEARRRPSSASCRPPAGSQAHRLARRT